MNIDKFNDFKFAGNDINKLMHKGNILWERVKNVFSGQFFGYDFVSRKQAVSSDGLTWTAIGSASPGGNKCMIVGDIIILWSPYNNMATINFSKDKCQTWSSANPHNGNYIADVCYDGTNIYCLDVRGNIAYTKDMVSWARLNTNIQILSSTTDNNTYEAIGYCKKYNVYVCAHTGYVYTSKDITNPTWQKITTCRGSQICTDGNELILYSENNNSIYQYTSSGTFNRIFTISTSVLADDPVLIYNGYVYMFVDGSAKFCRIPLGKTSTALQTISLSTPVHQNAVLSDGGMAITKDGKIYFYAAGSDNRNYLYEYDTSNGQSKATFYNASRARISNFICVN